MKRRQHHDGGKMQETDDNTLRTVGGRIRAVRKMKGLKMHEAAEQCGISRTSWSAWENDKVERPDKNKLVTFAKLNEINLDWLLEGTGHPEAKNTANGQLISISRPHIAELEPAMSCHAGGWDMQTRNVWKVPTEVIEMAFRSNPDASIIKRTNSQPAYGFGVLRGDYVLIDTSRSRIDEPGVYVLADAGGVCARYALAKNVEGLLRVVQFADEVNLDGGVIEDSASAVVLGRIMGIFRPC